MGHRMALNVLEELERTVGGSSKYRNREVRPEKGKVCTWDPPASKCSAPLFCKLPWHRPLCLNWLILHLAPQESDSFCPPGQDYLLPDKPNYDNWMLWKSWNPSTLLCFLGKSVSEWVSECVCVCVYVCECVVDEKSVPSKISKS